LFLKEAKVEGDESEGDELRWKIAEYPP